MKRNELSNGMRVRVQQGKYGPQRLAKVVDAEKNVRYGIQDVKVSFYSPVVTYHKDGVEIDTREWWNQNKHDPKLRYLQDAVNAGVLTRKQEMVWGEPTTVLLRQIVCTEAEYQEREAKRIAEKVVKEQKYAERRVQRRILVEIPQAVSQYAAQVLRDEYNEQVIATVKRLQDLGVQVNPRQQFGGGTMEIVMSLEVGSALADRLAWQL